LISHGVMAPSRSLISTAVYAVLRFPVW